MSTFIFSLLFACGLVSVGEASDQELLRRLEELERHSVSQDALLRHQQEQIIRKEALLGALQKTIVNQHEELVSQKSQVALMEQQIQRIESARSRRFVMDDVTVGQVGFNARLDVPALNNIALNQTIVYPTVVTNIGDAYSTHSGVFTAPKSGIYLISCTLTSDASHHHEVYVSIMKNSQPMGQVIAHGDSGHPDQSSSTVLLTLLTGDKVHVDLTGPEGDNTIWGKMGSNFVGVMINSA